MSSRAQGLISPVRTIVLAAVTAFLLTSATLPTPAQNSVPPTAVQAARMPQFAKRLAHPAPKPASAPNPAVARQGSGKGPGQGGSTIYENGPINGNTDAWTINFGFIVSDTFTVTTNQTPITGMSFGAWLFPGDTLGQVEVSITSAPNGGTSYYDQYVNFTQGECISNEFGYNVCTETGTFNGPTLNAGTYWLNLQNASVPSGDPVYWDENSGVGCESSGCPSQASNNSVGTIPSEAFTMEGSGSGSPTCYTPGGNLQNIYNFTQQQGNGEDGVVIDTAGNLYGATPNGGDNSAGFAFKLSHLTGWVLDPLFNFFGGDNGGQPNGVLIGANGSLYGGAQGGIQNCGTDGSQYCGLVFNLRPQPTACLTALCSWNENVPYRFSSETDGSGTVNVSASDQAGNLYGTTTTGGAHGAGTVFELTPSGGSWTKTTLYSFTGHNDGGAPTEVLMGNHGNLYGVAGGGFSHDGVVFQLTPSGGQWTEGIVHTFTGYYPGGDGYDPSALVQDGAGNLYGIAAVFESGAIFALQRTGSGWTFSEYSPTDSPGHSDPPGLIPYGDLTQLTIDTAGTLYGTGYYGTMEVRSPGNGPVAADSYETFIFKASYASGNWQYQNLRVLDEQYFASSGSLAVDANGNLYGTTASCGTYGVGAVWQLSP
jgi:uncharacterized repeat protein (TIGR03803 family)